MRMLLALLLLVLAVPACHRAIGVPGVAVSENGSFLPPPAGPGAVASADSPIPDVPMPIGFVPVPSRCTSSLDGMVRAVRHVYQGRRSPAELLRLYRRTLPAHDWRFRSRTREADAVSVLRYVKGPEALTVRLSRSLGVTSVEVTIARRALAQTAGAPSP